MPGQSLSAYVDDETAAAVEEITKATGVKKANFGGRALKFYAALSDDARRALTGIENSGTPQEKEFVMREVTRVLAIAQFKIAQRKLAGELNPELGGDGTGAAIDAAVDRALKV